MSLRTLIEKKYKEAIKSKNLDKANTLRLIKSAIKNKDIEKRTADSKEGIDDQKIIILLHNLIKQRKDSIKFFKAASRDDLIIVEKLEIDVIGQFLPQQLNEQEIEEMIRGIVTRQNFSSLKDMGALMNIIKTEHAGSVDMAIAGKIAKLLFIN